MAQTLDHSKDDIPVTFEDQEQVNEFSCLTIESREAVQQIAELREEIHHLQDAQEELLLSLDPSRALIKIGDTFFQESEDTIQSHASTLIKQKEKEIEKLQNQNEDRKKKMTDLKATLYARFGTKRINLDFD